MAKNKITTLGYFLKRLRDNGFITLNLWSKYAVFDKRKWTVLIDPEGVSLFITCYKDDEDMLFELNDGGNLFPKNYSVKTLSMEVIVTLLIEKGVPQAAMEGNSVFIKSKDK